MDRIRIVDVVDAATFALLPPCADPAFDHRTCDYWEDRERGSKAHRAGWLEMAVAQGEAPGHLAAPASRPPANPFAPDATERPSNPFAPVGASRGASNPFASAADRTLDANPFAPSRSARPSVPAGGPRKLGLLGRGLAVFGSYAKVLVLEEDDAERPAAYAQFGPLSAYPRALRLRELYSQLPDAPLPAVITCIATTADAHQRGLALRLVEAVCDDLAGRGFFAVEAYPEANARPNATSAATSEFWVRAGFRIAVDDKRFPVVRREL
jgi:ribosomal protein S18 acetylase RimI-like enzyme